MENNAASYLLGQEPMTSQFCVRSFWVAAGLEEGPFQAEKVPAKVPVNTVLSGLNQVIKSTD